MVIKPNGSHDRPWFASISDVMWMREGFYSDPRYCDPKYLLRLFFTDVASSPN